MTDGRAPLWPAYLATFTFMLSAWVAALGVPLHVVQLGGTLADAGILASIRFGLQALLQLPFGAVADALGTRRVLVVATTGNVVVCLVPLVAVATGSIVPLVGWAVLSGISSSLFLPSISAYVAVSAPDDTRGSAFGWLTLFTHTGVAAGPAIGGLVWDSGGPVPTYVTAAVLAMAALIGPLFVPRSMRQRIQLSRLPGMVAEVAGQRAIVGAWLAALAIGLPWGATAGLFPLFGTGLGLAAGTVGALLAVQSLANGASRVPLGRFIDGHRIAPIAAALAAAAYGITIGLLGFQDGVVAIGAVMVAAVVMLAFTLMLVQVTVSAAARPILRATALGGYGTSLSAGLGIGPFVAGGVADAMGFGWGFGAIGAVAVAVSLVAALVLLGVPVPAPPATDERGTEGAHGAG
jgi:MFS family permease